MYAWPSYHLAWLCTLILLTVFYTLLVVLTRNDCLLNKGFSRGRSRADLGEGCKEYAPLPPPHDLWLSNMTSILRKKKKNYVVYWC